MLELAIAVMVLGAFALTIGAVVLFRRGLRRQPMLMLVLAAILAANVAILTVPNERGLSPLAADPGD